MEVPLYIETFAQRNQINIACIRMRTIVSTSVPKTRSFYGSLPNHTILLDNLVCTGEEENLLECLRVPELNVGESDCTPLENAGVRCEGIFC